MPVKEYGKLSADQFRRLVARLPEIKEGARELPALLRGALSEKLKAVLQENILWAGFYELPFSRHVALALYVMGLKDDIVAVAQGQDPQEELLRLMDHADDLASRAADFDAEELAACLAAVIALQSWRSLTQVLDFCPPSFVCSRRESPSSPRFPHVRL